VSLPSATNSVSRVADVLSDVLDALASITTANGYHFDVKATSIGGDPAALGAANVTDLPVILVVDPKLDRSFDPSGRCRDVLTFDLYMRADVVAADTSAKLDLWTQMVADIETALAGTDDRLQRNGLALDTRLESVDAPGMALASTRAVLLRQPVSIRLQPRTYGQPRSQG
jgi:hypothetical protein